MGKTDKLNGMYKKEVLYKIWHNLCLIKELLTARCKINESIKAYNLSISKESEELASPVWLLSPAMNARDTTHKCIIIKYLMYDIRYRQT